ncbi:MAG: agmatinase [Candidatus Bathyarchaeota archaeon]|nr:agmatinase [Candidatus Bathyarchaeota archaeon]MDH5664248.1 agmatinase [Candidatus Bathyarchaeota archaeon]
MSYRELFVSPSPVFSGIQRTFEEAEYVILGAPLDVTSTYRSGARFAPLAIREASLNIETYSFRTNMDVEDLKIHDLGDLHIAGEVDETLKRLELVTKDLLDAKKMPVIIGGEHTITLGVMRSVGENVALVSFDAHLDMRNEYMDLTTSHTTFMRRINEQINLHKILEIGTRAVCKEELDYAKKSDTQFLTVQQIRRDGVEETTKKIDTLLADCEKIYLTIDMDVLDPAFAPAVQNPEPDGLDMRVFLDLLGKVCDHRIVAFDLVEVAPHYDKGITAIQAAKTIFEVLCHVEMTQKR